MKRKLFLGIILLIMYGIVRNPELSLASAKEGLLLWFNVLLPSLLPFIILSDLLISMGFVKILESY